MSETAHFRLQLILDQIRPLVEIRPLIRAGVDCLQVRIEQNTTLELVEFISQLRSLDVPVFVNGRVDLALELDTAGVQLGARHMTPGEARAIGFTGLIGQSIHDVSEVATATGDLLVFGHVYETASHPTEPPRGTESLRSVIASATVTVVAIGGISPSNIRDVAQSGASGVSVIGAVWNAPACERPEIVRSMRKEFPT